MHLHVASWSCQLCSSPTEVGQTVELVTELNGRPKLVRLDRSTNCPNQVCPCCKSANDAFPLHPLCRVVYSKFHSIDAAQIFRLGQALAPILLVPEPFESKRALQIFRSSFCRQTLEQVLKSLEQACTCKHPDNCYACLIRQLKCLPNEILANFVAPHAFPSAFQRVCATLGETHNLLQELQQRPSCQYKVSGRGAVFATCMMFRQRKYLTGLYDEEVPGAYLVKQSSESYDYIVVWLDEIGVSGIKFLSSDVCCSAKPSKGWVYAIAAADDLISVNSKGAFLKRIASAVVNQRIIFWDSAESPLLFEQQLLSTSHNSSDLFVHYVSLQNTSGVSIAFAAGEVLAIATHRGKTRDLSLYADLEEHAVWTHLPLSEGEEIIQFWTVFLGHAGSNMCALVVKTNRKTAYLGSFILPELRSMLQFTQIASNSVQALYYSKDRPHVIGAIPPHDVHEQSTTAAPSIPFFRTPVPDTGLRAYDLYYSEAPLTGVQQIHLCMEEDDCIGLSLQYNTYSQTVGQFRYDLVNDKLVVHPRYIAVTQTQRDHKSLVRVDFPNEPPESHIGTIDCQAMTGFIVWWYGKGVSVVSLLLT